MILYHGTNIDFDHIDLSVCLPYKDFGKGFYLTDIKDQAEKMAQRKSRRFGIPIVQRYFIEDEIFYGDSDCKILEFSEPTEDWAKFVMSNRERRPIPFKHGYDIVIGPVADDGVAYILNRYLEGSFTLKDVARELKFAHLNKQFFFGTELAISFLKRIYP